MAPVEQMGSRHAAYFLHGKIKRGQITVSFHIVDEDALNSAGPRLLDVLAVQVKEAAENPHWLSREHGTECFALALRVTVTVPRVLRHHTASGQPRLVNSVKDLQDAGRVGCGKEDGELQAESAAQGLRVVVRMIVKPLCGREDALPLLRRHVRRPRSVQRVGHLSPGNACQTRHVLGRRYWTRR